MEVTTNLATCSTTSTIRNIKKYMKSLYFRYKLQAVIHVLVIILVYCYLVIITSNPYCLITQKIQQKYKI